MSGTLKGLRISSATIPLSVFSCAQDYNWWWRSFLTSGFTAFYLAVYCIHYFVTKLEIEGAASTFLYFGYTSIMVFTFFLLTGNKRSCLLTPHPACT